MGLEEVKAIQLFVSETGWAVSPRISFDSDGMGYFSARWSNDRVWISVDTDGTLEMSTDDSVRLSIFRKNLVEPDCLRLFEFSLRWLWKK